MTARGEAAVIARNARNIALSTSLIVFALSILLWVEFDSSTAAFQFVERARWVTIGGVTINYHMGIDGISLFFVLLSTLLTVLCVTSSWISVHNQVREYMIAFLVLETMMVGIFCALDFVLFYVFFEGVLVPMFLIIGVWGGARRVYAAFKLPMWPVHTWLPDAHVEAPTAGSVILAGVLLKMGGYGFIRFSLPMFPLASADFAPFVFALSIVAIVYTSLVALVQEDVKKLIAYSSVAHMGFVTMGIYAATTQGIAGGIFQMVSHGIVSGALFLCVGVIYDRMHTREISAYGGLVNRMPLYAAVFMVFTL